MPYGVVPFIFYGLVYALAALVLYWVIRLAVRHGTLDAYRIDRTDQRIAAMKADIRRRGTPVGGPEAD